MNKHCKFTIIFYLFIFIHCAINVFSAETAIQVYVSSPTHVISKYIFGDWVEWTNAGQGLWDTAQNAPYPELLNELKAVNINLLRYPGGTFSDFFFWQGAVGPVSSRTPQINPFSTNNSTYVITEMPYFGVDEFSSLASSLGADMMITANAGSGTAADAAAWLIYFKNKGITPKYWEIGNEVYLNGAGYSASAVRKTPEQYAVIFDS